MCMPSFNKHTRLAGIFNELALTSYLCILLFPMMTMPPKMRANVYTSSALLQYSISYMMTKYNVCAC